MAEIPKTSIVLLKAISEDTDSVRWYDFYNRYYPVMDGYLRAAFPSLEADDIIQDVMLVLMKKLPGYRYAPDERGHFRNYLIGIVKYKAIEHLKRRKRDSDGVEAYKEGVEFVDSVEPARTAEEDLRHVAYEIALAQLMADSEIQERNKCVFLRVAVNNESPESVAKAYDITRNNVDQIKNRMIAKLREISRQWRHDAYEVALAQLMADPEIHERDKCVFSRVAVNNETLESVASAYGISRNDVDQIKNHMIAKLRELVSRLADM